MKKVQKADNAVSAKQGLLLQELDRMARHFEQLADELLQAGDDLRAPGAPPTNQLIEALTHASRDFVALRERILEQTRISLGADQDRPESHTTLHGLRSLVQRIPATERSKRDAAESAILSPLATIAEGQVPALNRHEEDLGLPHRASFPSSDDHLPPNVEEFLEGLINEARRSTEVGGGAPSQGAAIQLSEEISAVERGDDRPVSDDRTPSRTVSLGSETSLPETTAVPTASQTNLNAGNPDQEKHAQREQLYRKALKQAEMTLGPDHPDIADHLGNLALVFHRQGKYEEAEILYQRALPIREKALGTDHPKVATVLNNLALLYRDQGRNAEAQQLWEQSLAIVEKAFGPQHPKTALRLCNLADLFYEQGTFDRAEQLYQRLVEILEAGPVENRPQLIASLKNYRRFSAGPVSRGKGASAPA
jgi:tetratricopeptide (TPR) repeat protein